MVTKAKTIGSATSRVVTSLISGADIDALTVLAGAMSAARVHRFRLPSGLEMDIALEHVASATSSEVAIAPRPERTDEQELYAASGMMPVSLRKARGDG